MLDIIEGNILDIEEGIIAHSVNCRGVMGGGLALQIRNKWPEVYECYRYDYETYNEKYGTPEDFLGDTILITVRNKLSIANLYTQDNYDSSKRQTNYGAMALALASLQQSHEFGKGDVYIPYGLGCGLGGGDWEIVSEMIDLIIPTATIVRLG